MYVHVQVYQRQRQAPPSQTQDAAGRLLVAVPLVLQKLRETLAHVPSFLLKQPQRSGGVAVAAAAALPSAATGDEAAAVAARYVRMLKVSQFRMVPINLASHSFSRLAAPAVAVLPERQKRIAREVAALMSSLPLEFASGIHVRVDDVRSDLLKALITGPEGTPYANGCFLFDIFLPTTYPQTPPQVCRPSFSIFHT
jgi:baculoviral IAP repeat-containing protein 6